MPNVTLECPTKEQLSILESRLLANSIPLFNFRLKREDGCCVLCTRASNLISV
jgi:hypothetical protein